MLKGFEARLLALFLPLLLGVQLMTSWVVEDMTRERIVEQSGEALFAVSASFSNWLDDTVRRLASSAALLVSDFGFRSAIGSRDSATIESAIENARHRIEADAALVLDLDGRVIAADGVHSGGGIFPYPELLQEAELSGQAASVVVLDNRLMEFVLVPVRLPDIVAWIGFGVEIGAHTAGLLRGQSAVPVEVSFVIENDGRWITHATTTAVSDRRVLESLVASNGTFCSASQLDRPPEALRLDSGRHSISSTLLAMPSGTQRACMVIQRSLEAALEPFQPLFKLLWLFCIAGFLVGSAAAIGIARSITRSLKNLDYAAAVVQRGEYPEPLPIVGPTEIARVAQTFNVMVEGIADREQRIYRQANFDATTGLPNRTRLEHILESFVSDGKPALVFMIQLQNFREISNTLGHELGDQVIAECAKRIANAVKEDDVLCRLDGDKFALLAKVVTRRAGEVIASRIHLVFESPVAIENINVDIIIRIGLALFPDHGRDHRTLLRHAEIALDTSRERHCTHAVYDVSNDSFKAERLSMISGLRESMDNGDLDLHYQPKIDTASGRIIAAEALMRWQSPTRGFVPPDEFIVAAEHTGFIAHLTRWALDRAAADSSRWRARGLELVVSVNISARDLLDPRLPETVLSTLSRYELPSDAIVLEVTESSVMENASVALKSLAELASVGVKIAIDDFGTGHSSMAYVGDLPASELKIDKCFILDIVDNPKSETIVRTMIQLGHSFGMRICAEGVEGADVATLLSALGCDTLQGWHYSRALPADEFEFLFANWQNEAAASAPQPSVNSVRSVGG